MSELKIGDRVRVLNQKWDFNAIITKINTVDKVETYDIQGEYNYPKIIDEKFNNINEIELELI